MTDLTPQGREHWQRRRLQLRWRWWMYVAIAIVGGFFFIRSFRGSDPYAFAILLLIPLIALRQAWKTDRQMVVCEQRLGAPIIESKENP